MAKFDHEKLNVYQAAIKWVAWSEELLESVPKSLSVYNRLERASTSIPLNIAEGNGKHTSSDGCRFFDIARGFALECAACLDVLVARKKMVVDVAEDGKRDLVEVVSMLIGLIRANSESKICDACSLMSERGPAAAIKSRIKMMKLS